MSLLRQLWLVVLVSTLLAFIGGFAVNLSSARQYLEQQLLAQSADNAASLALSMSQQSKDPATAELLVSALFDAGHFRLIRYTDVHGKVVVERRNDEAADEVPSWFARWLPLKVEPGIGMVSNGWSQAGKVVVVAHERYAYQALWQGAANFCLVMMLCGGLSALAVTALIRWVRRPLSELMRQAEAIGERHFITIHEPNVTELRRVVRTMNLMVDRVKSMFAEQAARIDELRGAANRDALTALPNRDFFMGSLRQALNDEDAPSQGGLLLVRLHDLASINRSQGRAKADAYIRRICEQLRATLPMANNWLFARLNGADFALLAPASDVAILENQASLMLRAVEAVSMEGFTTDQNLVHIGVAFYQRGMGEGALLLAADQALAKAESLGANRYSLGHVDSTKTLSLNDWHDRLDHAIQHNEFELASFPVLSLDDALIHHEALLRLRLPDGELLTAGQFMPMAARLGLLSALDLAAVQLACERLRNNPLPLAINISSASINDKTFLASLDTLLRRNEEIAPLLWFEVNEYGLEGDYERLSGFSAVVRKFAAKVGIEHFGRQFGKIPALYDLRLDYIKIDGSFILALDQQVGNQQLIKAIVGVAEGAGLMVLAEQVHTREEWEALRALGVAGATGPQATQRHT